LSSNVVTTSTLTLAEVASALARRVREGAISSDGSLGLYRSFLKDSESFEIFEMTKQIIDAASAHLLASSGSLVRTLDAIHLATAEHIFTADARTGTGIVTADRRLYAAAAAAGVPVEDPGATEADA
jgi:predicted nucleic acid-binding protein